MQDSLVGVDQDVAEGCENHVEVWREGEGRREEVRVGSFVGEEDIVWVGVMGRGRRDGGVGAWEGGCKGGD